ncbi:MAG: polyprenyl synthetase, partial [Barrevirus sp.]
MIKIIIIICLILIIVYLCLDRLLNLYKNIKNEYWSPSSKHSDIDIDYDLTSVIKEQEIIDKQIKSNIKSLITDKKLKEILFYSLNNGKKVRPIILLSIYKQLTGLTEVPNHVMLCALSIEYTHTSSLIMDDIMDNDSFRRGSPSLHKKYNLSIAQLASILLFSLGMENL